MTQRLSACCTSMRHKLEAQHLREKLSMVVHAYSPALWREEAGNLLGLLPPASLIYTGSKWLHIFHILSSNHP